MTPQQLTGYAMLLLLFIGMTVFALLAVGWRTTVCIYAGLVSLGLFIWTALDLIHSK